MNIAADLDVEDRSILGSLKRAALLRGDEPAVVFTNGGSHSATELLASSGRLATSLAERGVTPGDRVALVMSNRVEFLWSFFGAGWLGACAVGLNVHLRGATMEHQLGLLDAAVVVCENETIEHIEAVFGNDPRIINVDTDPVFLELVEGGEDLPIAPGHKSSPADLAMITYTSGTTGLSKGTMYSQSMAIHFSDGMDWMFGYTEHDVAYSCLPLYHANAVMNALLPTLRKGAKTVFAPRFSASEFWSDVEAHRATATAFLGSMVPIIMSEAPAEIDAHNSLRIAQAVPVPDEHFHTFQERFGLKLFSMYGMSDIGPLVGVPHDMEGRPGKAGIAHPDWELLLVDDDGHPVPDGQAGEMLARPTKFNIMQMGYWRNPEATLEAWRDLWFHTGDYVRRDTDGWFEFVDRKKDAMRRFGENISSFEVEMALLNHPAIAEAAVYAVPAEMSEDEVMASIILKPGYANVEDEILTHCEKELPYFAVPRYYRMVDGMEKTPTEKVRKDLLRKIGVDNATWDAGPRGRSKKG